MEPVRAEYDGACITNLVRALQARADWIPSVARDARTIVLLVLDGLGWEAFSARRDRLPNIGPLEGGPITSVVPSTTPTALSSISTGLAPSEHGVVSYRMWMGNGVFNVIRWAMHGGGEAPSPDRIQPRDAFSGQPIPVVSREYFRDSKFTQILYRGAPFYGWVTTSGLIEHTRLLVQGGERFVYAYYDGLDVATHVYGQRDGFFEAEVAFCDEITGGLLDVLPETCALVVTADHGHVHFDERVELTDLASMLLAQSGESRFRYLHARGGAAGELLAAAEERYGDIAWVFSRDKLIDEGWLGPRAPSPEVRRRIGDVTLAAREPIGFVDAANPGEGRLLSGHGSLTAEEMLVPLVAGRGRA